MAVNILTENHWFGFIYHPLCCDYEKTAPGNVLCAPADLGMLPDESPFWHWELQRKEQNWAAPAGLHECCGSGYRDKSG